MADKTEMRVAGLRQIDSSPAPERPHPFSGHPAVRNSSSGAVRLAKSDSAPAFSGAPSLDQRGLIGSVSELTCVALYDKWCEKTHSVFT
jgi:hypothetical protein